MAWGRQGRVRSSRLPGGRIGAPATDDLPDQPRTAPYDLGALLRRSDVGLRMPDLFEDGSCGRLTLCQGVVHQGGQALQALPRPRELLDNDALQQLIGGPL